MGRKRGTNFDEKLDILKRKWGYVEIVPVTMLLTRERRFLVKNYKGELPNGWKEGDPLPGDLSCPKTIERSGFTRELAVNAAYAKVTKGRVHDGTQKGASQNGS